ncbi:MAG TPA: hypothetical protein VHA80_15450 [Solirubrobacterales bacterium]|jgi:hypothetical protein|nr:hypothetical protein [Solirubrobacterales bacterium]
MLAPIAILLLAVAILATAAHLRPRARPSNDDLIPCRSHAEASRRSDAEGL